MGNHNPLVHSARSRSAGIRPRHSDVKARNTHDINRVRPQQAKPRQQRTTTERVDSARGGDISRVGGRILKYGIKTLNILQLLENIVSEVGCTGRDDCFGSGTQTGNAGEDAELDGFVRGYVVGGLGMALEVVDGGEFVEEGVDVDDVGSPVGDGVGDVLGCGCGAGCADGADAWGAFLAFGGAEAGW